VRSHRCASVNQGLGMNMEPEFKCPKCGSTDTLHVHVLTTAHVRQGPDGNFETEVFGDHEWDSSYTMWCDCGHTANADRFFNPARTTAST